MRKRIWKVMQRLDLFTSHEQTCVIKQMHAYLQLEIILNIQQSLNNNEKHFSTKEQTHYFNFSQHMTFRKKSDSLNAMETKLLPLEAAKQPDTDKTGDNFIFSLELADI